MLPIVAGVSQASLLIAISTIFWSRVRFSVGGNEGRHSGVADREGGLDCMDFRSMHR